MMKAEKKPKKRKSMTAVIKGLREDVQILRNRCNSQWRSLDKAKDELDFLKQLIPSRFYKIKFKIKCNAGHIVDSQEIIKSYSPEMAVNMLIRDKTHPDSFELLDIQLLA